jgi:HNH endonuclease
VATAKAFAEDAILEAVLTDAGRVVSVTPAGRSISASTRRLLHERDQVCAVPGCGRRRHLEIHHLVAFALGGPTSLDNLVRICPHHHDQITYHAAALTGTHPNWTWTPPPNSS